MTYKREKHPLKRHSRTLKKVTLRLWFKKQEMIFKPNQRYNFYLTRVVRATKGKTMEEMVKCGNYYCLSEFLLSIYYCYIIKLLFHFCYITKTSFSPFLFALPVLYVIFFWYKCNYLNMWLIFVKHVTIIILYNN